MRVLVTGSRQVVDQAPVYSALSLLWAEWFADPARELDDVFTVVHGAAPGADTLAGQWVFDNRYHRVELEVHPAHWHIHGGKAGPIRNTEMVRLGADHVLAFFQAGAANVGTRDCVDRARTFLTHKGVVIEEIWIP